MGFKSFRTNVLLRIIFLSMGLSLTLFYFFVENNYLRGSYLLVFVIIILSEFFYYINRTNRDLDNFLTGILQKDYSSRFNEKNKGKTFNELYSRINRINEEFKKLSSEKEAQFLYLETLVEHITLGIISFNRQGEIHLMNEATRKLLGRPHIKNVKAIEKINYDLLQILDEIKPSETRLVKLIVQGKLMQLSVHCSQFKIQNESFKLISLQNIKNELEAQELDAWQKLIRVLTHEIMNSVTPITSLTSTLKSIMEKEKENSLMNSDRLDKMLQGLEAIRSRSEGLQKFTETYRSLTKIPTPKIDKVHLDELITGTLTLMETRLNDGKVKVSKRIYQKDAVIYADKELLQQVIINLVQNAVEALEDTKDPEIQITIDEAAEGRIQFVISDNGPGIDADKIDKIFVPFFTTKKNGSGIGLALSRQILQLHNASIAVESESGTGTSFQILI